MIDGRTLSRRCPISSEPAADSPETDDFLDTGDPVSAAFGPTALWITVGPAAISRDSSRCDRRSSGLRFGTVPSCAGGRKKWVLVERLPSVQYLHTSHSNRDFSPDRPSRRSLTGSLESKKKKEREGTKEENRNELYPTVSDRSHGSVESIARDRLLEPTSGRRTSAICRSVL